MRLSYLSQEAIDDIKMNYRQYKRHFKEKDNSWFLNEFKKKNWIHESKIECKEISLNMDDDYGISDRKNVEILYGALNDLSPSLAIDERLWAGMMFGQFWDYVMYRRRTEIETGSEKDVLNSFFFMRGTKRSCFINCLSRLWWTGFLLYDSASPNHYRAVDVICEKAYASTIMLLSSNNFFSNKELALGVIDCMIERKELGDNIGRYHYVEANKYINCIGGSMLLDTMSRKEICHLTNEHLNKIYGTLPLVQ